MTACIQRVKEARVTVDNKTAGQCENGLLIFLGVFREDTTEDTLLLADKIAKLRIFNDQNGKMNLSVTDIGGSALVISQFTLCASYKKGNRPDYLNAAPPSEANALYEYFISLMRERIGHGRIQTGRFGADMQVSLVNDGPVTIIMESGVLRK